MSNKVEDIIEVQMLGGFGLMYQNREIILGRNSRAKFIQLLQLVWIQGERGIGKEQLMLSLYERENLSNSTNSFNNLMYQMRRQMVRAGLPEGDYIIKQEGVYRMDPEIPVKIDALEFKTLYEKAQEEEDKEKKKEWYHKAITLYRGELLPASAIEISLMAESLQYKKMFSDCVHWLGNDLKEKKDFPAMYRLYAHAAELYPFDDWQVYQIDSLLYQEEYREAMELYDRTARLYSEEMGLPPSEKMMQCYERMSEKIVYAPNQLAEIEAELNEADGIREKIKGAYYCSYPGFVDLYRILCRNIRRTNVSIYLMLITLVDYEGKMIQNSEKLKARSNDLKEAIRRSLRKGDTFTRYSLSQYLILLIGVQAKNCESIYRRISMNFKKISGVRAEINYNSTPILAVSDGAGGSENPPVLPAVKPGEKI